MASYCYAEIDSNHHGHHPNTPCKACRLSTGADLPHPKPLGVVENRPLARAFSTGIFSNWTKLNAILKRFEPTIHKRWLKKSLKQRRDLLLSIVHDMPRVHRPDFEAWRKLGNARVSRERTCDANAHLWPYINLEDLLQGNNLLSFLNSRGHNLPETFASTDAKKASLGRGWQRACRSGKFVMVFDNKKTPRTCGSLVRLTTFPRGQRHLARIFNYHPNYGLLVLEIQQRIYDFLLRCAQAILHDFNPVDFLVAPHQPPTAVLDTKSDEAFKSISTHMVESEYRTPNKPSLERMKMLVESRLLATRDHLRGLREDPEYFLDSLKQWYDHHPLMPELDDLALWRDVAGSMIHDAVDNVRTWCCISRVIEAMRPIEKQMASAQVPGRFLREDDWPLWTMLSKCIGDFVGRPIFWIQTTFPRMPSIRSYYVLPHDPEKCDKLCQYGCESSWNVKCALPPGVARANKVFITLSTIHQSPLHSLHVCVQEAQYMLDHDKDASKFIDDWMHPFFSDLAVLADLQQSVDNFHPYSKTFTGDALCPNIENFVGGIADTTMCSIGASQRITKRACAEITSLGNPLDGRFKYPSEKRRTAESVAQMQRAEAALATFWADLKARLTNFDEVVQLYFDGSRMNPFATKDWQGQKATHLLKKRSPSTSSDETDYKNDTPFGSPTTAGSENKKSELTCKERSKTKTRGSASPPGAHPPPAPELQQEEPATTPSEPTQPIAIPRRAFKVMSALLPSPSTATQGAREIAWSEVLHAFCALGLAPEKLYGSVWIFRPGATEKRLVEVCRSIQWHEPKEVRKGNKIGARMVRRLGDRLKRAFGWDGETFCCAS